MAKRIFRCAYCDHRLRFGSSECSVCGQGTPVLNRRGLWVSTFAVLVLGAVMVVLAGL
ncbi:hypothetical protein LR948_18635 [Roseivivax sp. GX 12232]|uniref:hypothetical protein n=1 Tax=Roseivivax sp. GX 12232 TaxID=2900547 RepID=UPI001E4B63E7|nr:hypothetical protein [Roseivivax sp. GX 12232]MCE0507379.1 hypothetical protein [Roseivivax sp. GX 12232]